ncbi:hypothetical protein [Mangrovimonas cancribranchiae]|uniref:Uncharacterized protein n=1 Tax=Mangrovimonas cancribranchiae TaxID=3080055 RepID=A0AAU6NXH9_9FLAO
MKVGYKIFFDLDFWDENGNHMLKEVESIILDLSIDPLGIHETKCTVEYQGEKYGIPFSEIKNTIPLGEQLELFN